MREWLPSVYRVVEYGDETKDTFTVTLRGKQGGMAFQPGQFNMLYVFGVGEVPISISGDPSKEGDLIHTVRAVGTVTAEMKRQGKKAILGVRGPYGAPWPVNAIKGRDLCILTGGIGLAPLRPVIYHVLKHRKAYGRVILLYGARTPGDMLYGKEYAHWEKNGIEVHTTVDSCDGSWKGNIGVVTELIGRACLDGDRTSAFVCGPEIMMRFCVEELHDVGLEESQIWCSMERNMKCAIGFCGHCQWGPLFICKDGPVLPYSRLKPFFTVREW